MSADLRSWSKFRKALDREIGKPGKDLEKTFSPTTLRFRSIEHLTLRMVDYPLNEGGSIGIVSTQASSDVFRLDLKSIRRALEGLATKLAQSNCQRLI